VLAFVETKLFTTGRGKRGGIGRVWMLTVCAKNEAASIPAPILKQHARSC